MYMPCNIFLHFHNCGAWSCRRKNHRVVMAMECMMVNWPGRRSSSGSIRGENHIRTPCTDGAGSLLLILKFKTSGRWNPRSNSMTAESHFKTIEMVMVGVAAEDMLTSMEGVASREAIGTNAANFIISLAVITQGTTTEAE